MVVLIMLVIIIFTERNLSGGAHYLLKFTRLKRCDAFNLFTLLS